jgi:hypothetical protein
LQALKRQPRLKPPKIVEPYVSKTLLYQENEERANGNFPPISDNIFTISMYKHIA